MKSLFTRITIILAVITAVTACELKVADSKEWAEGNHCPYEGTECPNAQSVMRDYQIELHMDTLWVYDGDRLVGTHINKSINSYVHGEFVDSLIMADNL